MCSSLHWQVGSSWFCEKLSPANRNKGYRRVSRFREKLSPANWMQGVTVISRKISRSWAPRLQNSQNRWAKKWGPTCDRDISNSAIYTTAIYRAYTVLQFMDFLFELPKQPEGCAQVRILKKCRLFISDIGIWYWLDIFLFGKYCLIAAIMSIETILTLLMLETEYTGFRGSVPCLLMPWLLKSPEHQQAWY